MEIGKNTISLSPINFFTSFSVTSRKKLDQEGKCFIVSPQAKKNTIQHDQGEKHKQRIFSPRSPPAKVDQLIAWPRREKMKTQGEKNKDTGAKIKTEGEKYHIFSPS